MCLARKWRRTKFADRYLAQSILHARCRSRWNNGFDSVQLGCRADNPTLCLVVPWLPVAVEGFQIVYELVTALDVGQPVDIIIELGRWDVPADAFEALRDFRSQDLDGHRFLIHCGPHYGVKSTTALNGPV